MEMENNFDLRRIPPHNILFVVTSERDYDMSRIILAEDTPNFGDYVLIDGGHCSCYGFDETSWDAMFLNADELEKVLTGWIDHGLDLERRMADLAIGHVR